MWKIAIYLSGYGLFALSSIALISGAAILYSPQEVGVLAILIAIQFLLSQFAGVGIHFSILYYDSNNAIARVAPMHGLVNVLSSSILVSFCFYLLFPVLGGVIYSDEITSYAGHLSVYALLVATNKVFMAQLNARQHFMALGWIYGLKATVTLVMIAWSHLMQWPLSYYVASVVLLPEALGFFIFVAYAIQGLASFKVLNTFQLFKRDLSYGIKALWGALFLDSSTKIDILMLGAFTDSKTTGIYTFVALASDLFFQFTTLLRSWINPKITKAYIDNSNKEFLKFLKIRITQSYLTGISFMTIICASFTILIYAIPNYSKYNSGLPALIILSFFVCLCAGFFPLLQVFGQIGRPMTQSLSYLVIFITNVFLNLIFIPWLGMIGAALATGLSYVVYVFVFIYLIKSIESNASESC